MGREQEGMEMRSRTGRDLTPKEAEAIGEPKQAGEDIGLGDLLEDQWRDDEKGSQDKAAA